MGAGHLSNLSSLRGLTLNFGCTKITDVGLSSFIDSVKSLQNLTQFALKLNWCKGITDSSARKVGELLMEHSSLLDFKLISSETEVTKAEKDLLGCLLYTSPSPRDS
eukprot:TRINITY_DN6344_c0_g1_i2.p1 TRINITY_DN6344_c0_g1~~TRINITY_DN6344_c0_g1_i2.p1  ORF type:complete len:107 (-),score=13.89 TRINITY_DN6344_c0_g1_i2:37-357(-)